MKEIFERQWKLNIHTLGRMGLDFETTVRDPDLKPTWIENYRKALSAELAELIREVEEFGIGTQNGKIEIIDMLHFLVSLSHIVEVDSTEVSIAPSRVTEPKFSDCALKTFLALDELQNSLKWKWWAKGGGYKPDQARQAILELWQCFEQWCALFSLDLDTVKRIYIAKNEVNFNRQNQGYNEDTKTQADNQALKI